MSGKNKFPEHGFHSLITSKIDGKRLRTETQRAQGHLNQTSNKSLGIHQKLNLSNSKISVASFDEQLGGFDRSQK